MDSTAANTFAMPFTPYLLKKENTSDKSLSRAETKKLGDEYAISLIEEGLNSGRVSREQVMKSLEQ